jgi:NADPH:quinone reductase
MAVQIAKAVGARVIATAGSKEKLLVAKRFGADVVVDYSVNGGGDQGKWWDDVLRETGGRGVDVVFDAVGLVGDSLRCLRPKGRVLVVGYAGREGKLEKLVVNRVLLKQAVVIGYVCAPSFLWYGYSRCR